MSKTSSGIGFLGMLTILFIGLKLTHYIDWNWFWVLSPILIQLIIILCILIILIIAYGVKEGYNKWK